MFDSGTDLINKAHMLLSIVEKIATVDPRLGNLRKAAMDELQKMENHLAQKSPPAPSYDPENDPAKHETSVEAAGIRRPIPSFGDAK